MANVSQKKKQTDEEVLDGIVGQIGKGIKVTFSSLSKALMMAIVIYGCYYATTHSAQIYPAQPLYVHLCWLIPIFMLFAYGSVAPKGFKEQFEDIKFLSKSGEAPTVISKKKIKGDHGTIMEYVFDSKGIPTRDWKMRRIELETALDCNIVSIRQDNESKRKVIVRMMDSSLAIPTFIRWSDEYISDEDFVLVVGEGLMERVGFDFNKYPHALVAGQTGSGKSVILRGMLWQSIKKGAKLYIMDFKGGVEFDRVWEQFATVVTEEEDAIAVIRHLQSEMKQRLDLFRQEGVKNIVEYNKKNPDDPLCRIILGCDEVAEMLDMEGLDKEAKAQKQEISQGLASLARLSRAAGINMILGMQRPDAKVLKGQIKNNLPIRISGRFADPVASQIVLNSDRAAYLDETRGRFLYTIGGDILEFQSYLFEDDQIVMGNYQIGRTLNTAPLAEAEQQDIGDMDYREFEASKEEHEEWNLDDDLE